MTELQTHTKRLAVTSLLCGLSGPAAYWAVRALLERAGYSLFPLFFRLPSTLFETWPVALGAALLGAAVAFSLTEAPREQITSRALRLGVLSALLNVPLSVLLALTFYHLKYDWEYGYSCLLQEWYRSLPAMVLWAAPLAIPLGLGYGAVLAGVELRVRRRRNDPRAL